MRLRGNRLEKKGERRDSASNAMQCKREEEVNGNGVVMINNIEVKNAHKKKSF